MRKVLAATLTCLMALLLAMPSIAQTATPKGKFDVRIKLKNNDCIAKKIVLLVQVKAHDANSTFKLGDANFRFDYDPAVVINPKNISQENFSNVAPASDTNYGTQTLTGSKVSTDGKTGIVSLNVLYSGSNAGAKLVGTDYITVACIQFDIVKGDGCVNFKWHNNNPATDFPITGMNEIIETSADPYDYENPVVPSGDVFESYNVCLNTLCANPTVDAINDSFTTNINTPVMGNALTNDIPATGLTVKTSSLGTPLHGSISMSSTGAFTYTPSTGYVGKDSVEYEACNSTNVCDKAFIIINITGPAPAVNRDVFSTNINTATTGNLLANDTPNGGLTVKISPFPTPLHGSLTLSTNGNFTYTPATGYVGKDSIQYEACNGNNVCAKAWAVFTTTGPVQEAPIANRDTYSTPVGTAVSGNVLTNDTPAGALTVKISPFPTPLHGSLTLSSNGAFTYTPTAGYVGKDSIQYEACNSDNQCAKAWAVFTMTSPAPVANRDTYTTNINTAVSGNVLTNDTPAGTLTVKVSPFPTPLHGGLSLSSNGAFTYTPNTGYVGKDSIQYEACNTANQCVKAWAVFTITGPTPVPPVVNRDTFSTPFGTPVSGNVLTNDTPAGGLTVKISPFPTPLHGSFTFSTNGAFTYTPTAGYVGKDSIQYEACNSANQCAKAWAVFDVTSPAPVANRDAYSTQSNTAVSGNVLMNDTPAGTLTVKVSPLPTPLHGGLSLSSNGAFTYTPNTGYVGKDSIQYEACNTNNQCVKAWAVFTVTGQTNPTAEIDLALIKTVSQKKSMIGDLITYTISLTNQSNNLATGVTVKDYMPVGAMYKSYSTSTGTYDSATGIWKVGNVAAKQTINLMITVQAQAQGTFFNVAEVMTSDQTDVDSKPGNTYATNNTTNPLLEDDNASACFYVPIEMCEGAGEEYDITVPQGYQGIQWYKNGTAINGATASTLRVNSVGTYTFTTLVGNCPAGGCCPAEFINVNCCKPTVCVPYTVTKTKSGKK
jgi:uncharacterized repeat protein (TIGR01451 family)